MRGEGSIRYCPHIILSLRLVSPFSTHVERVACWRMLGGEARGGEAIKQFPPIPFIISLQVYEFFVPLGGWQGE
jgi:hypothetical protein